MELAYGRRDNSIGQFTGVFLVTFTTRVRKATSFTWNYRKIKHSMLYLGSTVLCIYLVIRVYFLGYYYYTLD